MNRILSGKKSGVSLLRKLVTGKIESHKEMLKYYLSKLDSEHKKKNFIEMLETEIDNESFFLYLCDKGDEQFDLILKKYYEVKGGDALTQFFFEDSYSTLFDSWRKPFIYKIYRKNPGAFDKIFWHIRQASYEVRKKAIFAFIKKVSLRKWILHANPAYVKLVSKLWQTILPEDREEWFKKNRDSVRIVNSNYYAFSRVTDMMFILGKWLDIKEFLNFLKDPILIDGVAPLELRIFVLLDRYRLLLSQRFEGRGILQFFPEKLEHKIEIFKLRSMRTGKTCLETLLCRADKQLRETLFQSMNLEQILSIIFPDGLNQVAKKNFFESIQQSPDACLQFLEFLKTKGPTLYEKEIICPEIYRMFFDFGTNLTEPDLREKIAEFKKEFLKPEFVASYLQDMIENPILSVPQSSQAMISAFLKNADAVQVGEFFGNFKEKISSYLEEKTSDKILYYFRGFLFFLEKENNELENKPYSDQITQCRIALFNLWVEHLCRQEKNFLDEWQKSDDTGDYLYPELRKAYIKAKFEQLDRQDESVKYASSLYWIFFKAYILNVEESVRQGLREKMSFSYSLFVETFSANNIQELSKEKFERLQEQLFKRIEKNVDYLKVLLPEKTFNFEEALHSFQKNSTLSHANALAEKLKNDLSPLENEKSREVAGVVLDTLFCALIIPIIVKLLYHAFSSKPVGFFGKTKSAVVIENLSDLANKLSLLGAESNTSSDSRPSP